MNRYQSTISMTTILKAITYYENLGYNLLDVPQCVDFDVSQHTKPEGLPELFHAGMKVYVASAEQSFIQLHKDGNLSNGKYMAVTPCYRHECFLDDTHYSMFLKLELIVVGEEKSDRVCLDAKGFFKSEGVETVAIRTQEAKNSLDLMCGGIEVGSYGVRDMIDGSVYTYGTGIAEPRFSSLIGVSYERY